MLSCAVIKTDTASGVLTDKLTVICQKRTIFRCVFFKVKDTAALQFTEIPLLRVKLKSFCVNTPHFIVGYKLFVSYINFTVAEYEFNRLKAALQFSALNSKLVRFKISNVFVKCLIAAKQHINVRVLFSLCKS